MTTILLLRLVTTSSTEYPHLETRSADLDVQHTWTVKARRIVTARLPALIDDVDDSYYAD